MNSKKVSIKETLQSKPSPSKIESFINQFSSKDYQSDSSLLEFICSNLVPDERISDFNTLHVEISGQLTKQKGTSRKKKAKRWCIIRNRTLFYYKDQGKRNPYGMIPLDGVVASMNQDSNKQLKKSFSLISSKVKNANYEFVASSQQEAQQWIDAITKANEEFMKISTKVQGVISIAVNHARDLVLPKNLDNPEIFCIVFINKRQFSTNPVSTSDPRWSTSYQTVIMNRA